MVEVVCREKLIVRKPPISSKNCLKILKNAMKDVGFSDDEIEGFLSDIATPDQEGDIDCGWSRASSCLDATVEECILDGGTS